MQYLHSNCWALIILNLLDITHITNRKIVFLMAWSHLTVSLTFFACIPDSKLLFYIYQSDSAGVEIPELELELTSGTLGGMVTTVEGLITKISESEYHVLPCFLLLFVVTVSWMIICGCIFSASIISMRHSWIFKLIQRSSFNWTTVDLQWSYSSLVTCFWFLLLFILWLLTEWFVVSNGICLINISTLEMCKYSNISLHGLLNRLF